MANEKDFTIEELTKACEEAKSNFEQLDSQLKQALREEEAKKKAQLALEKEARQKEVEEAIDNAESLLKAYVKDYGTFSYGCGLDDYGLTSKRAFPWWF